MKLEDFQTLLFARESADAFFTGAPSISVFKQINRDVRKLIQSALASAGIAVVVGLPDCQRTSSPSFNEFEILCDLEIFENPTKNETGKTGFQCADQTRGNLEGKILDEVLSPLRVMFAGFSREQDGISIFRVQVRTLVRIDPTTDA